MKTKNEAIDFCLSLGLCYEDYPFDDNWAAIRHNQNHKTFAFVYQRNGANYVNLKAVPELAAVWRQTYPSVSAAYHMNKLHWITVALDGVMADEDIFALIKDSYELTAPKRSAKRK